MVRQDKEGVLASNWISSNKDCSWTWTLFLRVSEDIAGKSSHIINHRLNHAKFGYFWYIIPLTSALYRKWLFWLQICLPKESRCFSHKHLIGKFNEIRLQQGDALIISYPHTRMRPLNRLPLPHLQRFSCAYLCRPTMYIWNIHICQLKSPNQGWFLKRRCLHHPVFVLPEKQSRDLAHPLRILFLDVFFPAEVKRASAQKPGPNCSCRRFPSSLQWDWLDDCVHVLWKLLVLRLGTSCWVIQAGIWISWSAEVFSSLMLIRLCGPTLLGWTHLSCHIQK